MDWLGFFLLRYGDLHGRLVEDLLAGLSEDQVRRRPDPRVNTIAWLLWHAARIEDVGVNGLVADRPQVLDDEEWLGRMKLVRRSEEHTSELQSHSDIVCRLLLEKK